MRSVQRGISTLFLVVAILAIAVASAAAYFAFSQNLKEKVASINSFEECAKLYPVMESYPEQCNTPDGKHFTRELSEEEKKKLTLSVADSSEAQEMDTHNFPVYPGSVYVKQVRNQSCSGKESGFSNCGTVSYIWETKDDFDRVSGWYREGKSGSGWICRGGAGEYGGPREANATTSCKKDSLNYDLDLRSNEDKTEIMLSILY